MNQARRMMAAGDPLAGAGEAGAPACAAPPITGGKPRLARWVLDAVSARVARAEAGAGAVVVVDVVARVE